MKSGRRAGAPNEANFGGLAARWDSKNTLYRFGLRD